MEKPELPKNSRLENEPKLFGSEYYIRVKNYVSGGDYIRVKDYGDKMSTNLMKRPDDCNASY